MFVYIEYVAHMSLCILTLVIINLFEAVKYNTSACGEETTP